MDFVAAVCYLDRPKKKKRNLNGKVNYNPQGVVVVVVVVVVVPHTIVATVIAVASKTVLMSSMFTMN